MYGLKTDWAEEESECRYFTLQHYEGITPRWCPGCGDLAVLTAVQRLCRDEQLPPEKTVIGVEREKSSSRRSRYRARTGAAVP
jgi:2-oxoglutarate ferredoxin oxidoreductase subunit beta